MNDIEELEKKIKYYSEKYYAGVPEIDDETFDMLVLKLKAMKKDSTVLTTGWGFEVEGNKVKHKYSHIGSLDKCKNFNEIPDRFKYKQVFLSPKLDGLSAVAYYKDGKLVQGITRGNGEYGKDITDKLYKILGPEIQDKTFTGAVRGELIISDSNWKILQNKYVDLIAPRNFAAGVINRKEIDEDIQYIDLVVYKIVGQETIPFYKSRSEIIMWLNINFKHAIPQYYYPILNEATWETYHKQTFDEFIKLGYGLDGLVLTNPEVQYNTNTKGYLYDEVAFKFAAEKTNTIINNIEWTLSRTDRLIPVANIEPVELSGAIIKNATCNNAKWVKDLGLGTGAEVVITRSNEVIPKILEVIQSSDEDLPTKCPICNSELVWDGVDLKCINEQCPNKDLSNLQQWCEVIGETDGLQWTLMKQYLDIYNIKSINDLYNKQNNIWSYFSTNELSITEQKIKEFFQKLYFNSIEIEKALLALNIPRLGNKTSELMSRNVDLCKKLINYGLLNDSLTDNEKLAIKSNLLDVVKDATTKELLANVPKLNNLKYIQSRIVFKEINNVSDAKYIAVTGSLQSMKRKDFEKYIKEFGYELNSNLKKCKFLVNNDINSTSTKNKQAKEYGVPIITEQEFLNMLK